MKRCCLFCENPSALLIEQSEEDLMHVILERRDQGHAIFRVYAYIEMYFRCGVFDPLTPYRVWQAVMGDAIPPCQFGRGAFPFVLPEHKRFLCYPVN